MHACIHSFIHSFIHSLVTDLFGYCYHVALFNFVEYFIKGGYHAWSFQAMLSAKVVGWRRSWHWCKAKKQGWTAGLSDKTNDSALKEPCNLIYLILEGVG